jgi:hypothetical protein
MISVPEAAAAPAYLLGHGDGGIRIDVKNAHQARS